MSDFVHVTDFDFYGVGEDDVARIRRARASWPGPQINLSGCRRWTEGGQLYIRDLVNRGFEFGERVLLTNSDSFLFRGWQDEVNGGVANGGEVTWPWYSYRHNVRRPLRPGTGLCGSLCSGVDAVGITREFWESCNYPDMLLGFEGWDWVFKFMILNPVGPIVGHEVHGIPAWQRDRFSAGQLHNRKLAKQWAVSTGRFEGLLGQWLTLAEY